MKRLIALAASAALIAGYIPTNAVAEEVEHSSTSVGGAGQTLQTVQARQGGLFSPGQSMGVMLLCEASGPCQVVNATGSTGPSGFAQVAPILSSAVFGIAIRPTRISEDNDTNVSNGSSSNAASNQSQGQSQEASAETGDQVAINTAVNSNNVDTIVDNVAFGGGANANSSSNPFVIANAEGGNASANPLNIANATNENDNTAFGGIGVGLGGDGGNATGGSVVDNSTSVGEINNDNSYNCTVTGPGAPNSCTTD